MENIWVKVFTDSGTSLKREIITGNWQVWGERRIKEAYNFGKGTFEDFKHRAKANRQVIFSLSEFRQEIANLPTKDLERVENWLDTGIEREIKFIYL